MTELGGGGPWRLSHKTPSFTWGKWGKGKAGCRLLTEHRLGSRNLDLVFGEIYYSSSIGSDTQAEAEGAYGGCPRIELPLLPNHSWPYTKLSLAVSVWCSKASLFAPPILDSPPTNYLTSPNRWVFLICKLQFLYHKYGPKMPGHGFNCSTEKWLTPKSVSHVSDIRLRTPSSLLNCSMSIAVIGIWLISPFYLECCFG